MAADTATANQSNGGDLLITIVIFQVLTWISVALRAYVRTALTKNFQFDDWLMLVAQVNFTLSCAFIAVGLTVGLGHHNAVLPQKEEILAIKWQALATATYISNMMFIKLSIGVFLLRLATQRRYKWIIWASMGIIASMSSALFLWDVFQCKPVAAQWDYTIPSYTCASTTQVVDVAYVLSALSIVSDWLYALLPIPMLWKAKMTPQAKATVSIVLGLGIFASVATIIRVNFLADLTDAGDILYAGTNPMVWTLVEPGVAIVASSLVTIRPLLRQLRFKGFESTERSRSRGFWARYGRGGGGGGASKLEENSPTSKRSRASRGIDAFEAGTFEQDAFERADIRLGDLEAGNGAVGVVETIGQNCKSFHSREKTLRSRDEGSRDRKPVMRNFSKPPGVIAVREKEPKEGVKLDGTAAGVGDEDHEDDDDDDDSPPLSPWPRMEYTRTDSPESVFVIQGCSQEEGSTLRGHLQNGKTVWRSEGPPKSSEEAEAIQGLRDDVVSRTGQGGRSPFS